MPLIQYVPTLHISCYKSRVRGIQILSYFSDPFQLPVLPDQMISGGEYFATLRLIQHAKMGKVLSKDLIFFQGWFTISIRFAIPSTL
jgi:hypothetical protein